MEYVFGAIKAAPFLFILILFVAVFTHLRNKSDRLSRKRQEDFWDKEMRANTTRKKDISNLPYIRVPSKELIPKDPADILPDPAFISAATDILSMENAPVLNLNGISNTDLKLTYGAANLPALSEADNNYTALIAALTRAGTLCHENGQDSDAARLLEYSVEIESDAAAAYTALKEIYSVLPENEKKLKIKALTDKAEKLSSIRRDAILEKLSS